MIRAVPQARCVVVLQGPGKTRITLEMQEGEARGLSKGKDATVRATCENRTFKGNEIKMHSGIHVQFK